MSHSCSQGEKEKHVLQRTSFHLCSNNNDNTQHLVRLGFNSNERHNKLHLAVLLLLFFLTFVLRVDLHFIMESQPKINGHPSNRNSIHDQGLTSIKAVIVGDGGCGKTSLLMVFAKGDFPETYIPTVFERYTAQFNTASRPVEINLWDTAGQEDYDRLRPLSYSSANVVLICYDVTSPTSFDNVAVRWNPEVRHFCKGVPVLLIGCKTDLRKDRIQLRKLRDSGQEPITYTQGVSMARQIRAVTYLECSAKFRENIEDIFNDASNAALSAMKGKKRHWNPKRKCIII